MRLLHHIAITTAFRCELFRILIGMITPLYSVLTSVNSSRPNGSKNVEIFEYPDNHWFGIPIAHISTHHSFSGKKIKVADFRALSMLTASFRLGVPSKSCRYGGPSQRTYSMRRVLIPSLFVFLLTSNFAFSAPITQVGLGMDGSSSISASDFNIMRNSMSNALLAVIPTNSTVEITVVQF